MWQWGDRGPWVVLLHGWGSHAARFGSFISPLRAAGFSVIGIDAPAHGASPGRLSDLPRFRDCLAEVLRAHAPVHAVVGHSLGGGAVLTVLAEIAEHHPKKICLFGVPSDMDYILESFAMMLGLDEPARADLRERFTTHFGRPAAAISVAAAAPSVRIPVLVVHDEEDNVAPFAQGAALASAIPHATLWRTQGLGHSGALRDAGTIERVVDFLRADMISARLEARAEEQLRTAGFHVEQEWLVGIDARRDRSRACCSRDRTAKFLRQRYWMSA